MHFLLESLALKPKIRHNKIIENTTTMIDEKRKAEYCFNNKAIIAKTRETIDSINQVKLGNVPTPYESQNILFSVTSKSFSSCLKASVAERGVAKKNAVGKANMANEKFDISAKKLSITSLQKASIIEMPTGNNTNDNKYGKTVKIALIIAKKQSFILEKCLKLKACNLHFILR